MFSSRTRRIRPKPNTIKKEYGHVFVTENGIRRCITLPVNGDIFFTANLKHRNVEIYSDDFVLCNVSFIDYLKYKLSMVRKSIRRSVLNFDHASFVPEGNSRQVKAFRRQIRFARNLGLSFDGEDIQKYPQILEGWASDTNNIAPYARANVPHVDMKIAVVIHLYYTDLWDEFKKILLTWVFPFSIILTIVRDDEELRRDVKNVFPEAEIIIVDNIGRDVRPFLLLLELGKLDKFGLVCKVHGKRSLGGGRLRLIGDIVRRAALLDLMSTGRQASKISMLFSENPDLGIVGSKRFLSSNNGSGTRDVIGLNRQSVESLASKMNSFIQEGEFDFFEGTMFWARPAALSPLRKLALAADAFSPESGRLDGALEHAVERLFNHSARTAGFKVAAIRFSDAASLTFADSDVTML